MYGVPNMKCDKNEVVTRRVKLLEDEGVVFRTKVERGKDMSLEDLKVSHGAVLLAVGSTIPRDLSIEGRGLTGIHFAMSFLRKNTQSLLDSNHVDKDCINVKGKHVVDWRWRHWE